jgi:hypothetical protein
METKGLQGSVALGWMVFWCLVGWLCLDDDSVVGKYQRESHGGERPSTRAQSRNLPSVFDIAWRLGLSCIFGGLVSIYIDVEV